MFRDSSALLTENDSDTGNLYPPGAMDFDRLHNQLIGRGGLIEVRHVSNHGSQLWNMEFQSLIRSRRTLGRWVINFRQPFQYAA